MCILFKIVFPPHYVSRNQLNKIGEKPNSKQKKKKTHLRKHLRKKLTTLRYRKRFYAQIFEEPLLSKWPFNQSSYIDSTQL